jgi:hypothetical protein
MWKPPNWLSTHSGRGYTQKDIIPGGARNPYARPESR